MWKGREGRRKETAFITRQTNEKRKNLKVCVLKKRENDVKRQNSYSGDERKGKKRKGEMNSFP